MPPTHSSSKRISKPPSIAIQTEEPAASESPMACVVSRCCPCAPVVVSWWAEENGFVSVPSMVPSFGAARSRRLSEPGNAEHLIAEERARIVELRLYGRHEGRLLGLRQLLDP